MNVKTAYKYQLANHRKAIIEFYLIILSITLLFLLIWNGSGRTSINGIDGMSPIFLFVIGLWSFKEPFHMMIQNGISRKSMFIGKLLTMLSVGIGMALIDKGILLLGKLGSGISGDKLIFLSLYEQIYITHVEKITTFQMHVEGLVFNMLLYLSFIAMAYFITTLFHRLTNFSKIIISVGVPIGIFVVLPIVDTTIANSKLLPGISKIVDFALGTTNQNPYHAIITFISMCMVFSALSWLLLKRAEVKE